jgi:hypothetical protein
VSDQPRSHLARIRRRLGPGVGKAFLFALLTVAAFVLIEGLASVVFVAREVYRNHVHPDAERSHTRYDPEIGWVNTPRVRLPDFYGLGRTLTTNARGFRGTRDVADGSPEGKLRIVCSGDSYTLGFGVGDDDTWCHLLETLDPGRETVNMGQGGYGIDQAWLWYRRDARTLKHQVHIFAFIFDDFRRMLHDEFDGYGKPLLRLERGSLRVENVPVPRRGYLAPWLTQNVHLARAFRSVTFLDELYARLGPPDTHAKDALSALPLALSVLDDVARLNRMKGSFLVLVFLPECAEDINGEAGPALRAALARETTSRGIPYVDLVPEMCGLPKDVVDGFFLPDSDGPVPELGGHYSAAGNRFVAEALDRRLRALVQR